MSNNTFEILNPNRTGPVPSLGREVTVRELSWANQKSLLERLTGKLAAVMAAADQMQVGINIETVTTLIQDSQDLCETLVLQTSTIKPDEIGKLSITEVFALVDMALELNMRALEDGAKKAFGRITNFVGKSAAAAVPTPAAKLPAPSTS